MRYSSSRGKGPLCIFTSENTLAGTLKALGSTLEYLEYWEFLVFEPNIKFLSNVLFSPIRCHSLHVELPQTAGYDHWSVVQSSEHILYKINVYTCSALIAICGVVIQNLIVCFTPPDKIIFVYLASFFSILSICITTVCRSLISKVTFPA